MTASSLPESLALQLVRARFDSTDGLPQQWRMLEEQPGMTVEAIVFAVAKAWVVLKPAIPSVSRMQAGAWNGDARMADLERVLQQLHDSEINAGVQTFYDARTRVWIGDEINSIRAEMTINRTPAARLKWPEGLTAASWLHETALRLYPDSKYAKNSAD